MHLAIIASLMTSLFFSFFSFESVKFQGSLFKRGKIKGPNKTTKIKKKKMGREQCLFTMKLL